VHDRERSAIDTAPLPLAVPAAPHDAAAPCAWCGAPRGGGPRCGRCGADYLRAAQIRRHGRAEPRALAPAPVAPASTPVDLLAAEPPEPPGPIPEWKLRVFALPAALLIALAFHALLPSLQRMFFGMPVHELGHAVTAWFTGHVAVPMPWFTRTFGTRDPIAPIALAVALGWVVRAAWRAERPAYAACGVALLLVQAIFTLGLSERTSVMLFTFGGDAGGMVLATLAMLTFPLGGRRMRASALRWGFLVIGSAAFADIFPGWWTARHDIDAIAFGETDYGRSDPVVLMDDYGWTIAMLIRRHVGVGLCCLAVLAAIYAWDARRAWRGRRG